MTTRTHATLRARIETADHAKRLAAKLAPTACSTCPHRVALPADLHVGSLVLNIEQCRAKWKGVEVVLTVGEFSVVHLLASQPGRFIRYRAIYDVIKWPGFQAGTEGWGYRGNVRSMIKRIRRKFLRIDSGFVAITNFTSLGYAWEEKQ